ncbi:MAG: phage portal protein family protein [Alsobacter sp.]
MRIQSAYAEPVSAWTPGTIRAALDEHEQARFYTSATLADATLRDPRVMRGIKRRTGKLASRSALPFAVEPGNGDGRSRERIRARTEALWWDAHPESTIGAFLRDTIFLGLCVGFITWERTANEWRPKLHHLAPHGLCWWSWSNEWTYTTGDGEVLKVTPGDGTWFLHLPYGDRSWMMGAIRCVGLKWLMREDGWIHWARSDERHSSPTLAIKEPHFATDDVEGVVGTTQATQFYRDNMKVGPNVVLRLPQGPEPAGGGWEAEWLELTGEPGKSSQSFIQALASEFDVALLGSDSDGSAKGGDGELASEQVKIEDLAADAETFSTSLREQVWKPFAAFNYSPADTDNAAWGRWATRPATDLKARAETLNTAADALTKLIPLGADPAPIGAEFAIVGNLKAPAPPVVAAPGAKPGEPEEQEETKPEEPAED